MPFTVKRCCCCINLRIGCIIIGAVGLTSSIGAILRPDETEGRKFEDYFKENPVWEYIIMSTFIVGAINYASLLLGAIISNRGLACFFVVAHLLILAVQAVVYVFLVIVTRQYALLGSLISFVLPLYGTCVVYSFYKEMETALP